MSDIFTLGIGVDSRDVRGAADDLERLAAQGQRTEGAMGRLVRAARDFGSGFRSGALGAMREYRAGTDGIAKSSRGAADGVDRLTRSVRQQSLAAGVATAAIRRLAGPLAAMFAVRNIVQSADAYANLSARLLLATGSSERLAIAQAELSDIAHRTRSGLDGTIDLFARLTQSTESLGKSQSDVLAVTETINQAMAVSGTSAQGAAAALTQLGQAFGAGVLRGEELNSILEQAPRLARAIAEGMDVSVGSLRKLGAEGKLTADKVFEALQKSGSTIASEFSKMPLTIGGATTQVRNALLELIGGFTNGAGMAGALAEAISDLATGIKGLAAEVPDAIRMISNLIEQFRVGKEMAGGFWSAVFRYGTDLQSPEEMFARTTKRIAELNAQMRRDEQIASGGGFRGFSSRNAAKERMEARKAELEQLEKDLRYYGTVIRQGVSPDVNAAMAALGGEVGTAGSGTKPKPGATEDAKDAEKRRKAMLDAEVSAIRRGLREMTSAYGAAETILEAQRSAGLVNEKEYYEAKRSLIKLNADAEAGALDAEIKRLKAEKTSGPERIKALSQIADLESKARDVRTSAAVSLQGLALQEKSAMDGVTRSFREARLAAQEYLDTLVQQQGRELDMMGLGQRARDRQSGLDQIDDRYSGQRRELENQRALLEMEKKWTNEAQEQYNQRLAIINEFHAKARTSYEEFWAFRQQKEDDALLGARDSLQNYIDESNNLYAQMGDAVANATQRMEDALASFVTTGKLDFKSLANSIIADLVRIQMRAAMSGIFEKILSGMSGGGLPKSVPASLSNPFGMAANAKGNVYDSPSLSRYSNGVYNRPQFFAFAKGAGVFAEAGPEAIMPLKRGKDGRLGVSGDGGTRITINSTVNAAPGANVAELQAFIDARDAQLEAKIVDGMRRGRYGVPA